MMPKLDEQSDVWNDMIDSKRCARPAKVALLVWRAVCTWLSRTLKNTGRGTTRERLHRLLDQQVMMRILTSTAQWERYASNELTWTSRDSLEPEEADRKEIKALGEGWWPLESYANFRIGVADATAAMLYGMQFGGSTEYGGTISDLSYFVKEYTANCRINFPIPAYTADDRRGMILERSNLQWAFASVAKVRNKFQLDAKLLVTELTKRRADARNFDSVFQSDVPENKIFDDQVDASKMLADALLAAKRVHTYRQLGKVFASMQDLAAELDQTAIQADDFAAASTSGNAVRPAVVVRPPEPRRRGLTTARNVSQNTQKSAGPEPVQEQAKPNKQAKAAKTSSNLKFEDKEAHEKQLKDLQRSRTRLIKSVDSLGDKSSRMDQLVKLMEQGHDKMTNISTELTQTETQVKEVLDVLNEELLDEAQASVQDNLDKGKLPQEMMAQIEIHQQSGPSTSDRDKLRQQNARLRAQIEESAKETEHEQRLQQHLEELKVEVNDLQETQTKSNSKSASGLKPPKGQTESKPQETEDGGASTDEVLQNMLSFVNAGVEVAKECQAEVGKRQQLFASSVRCDKAGQALCKSMGKMNDGYAIKAFQDNAAAWTGANKDFCMDIDNFVESMEIHGLPDEFQVDAPSMSETGTKESKKQKRKTKGQNDDDREVQKLYQVLEKVARQVDELGVQIAEQRAENASLQNAIEVSQGHVNGAPAANVADSAAASLGEQIRPGDPDGGAQHAQESNNATAGPRTANQDNSPSAPSAGANRALRQPEAQIDRKIVPAGNASEPHAILLMKLQNDIASALEQRQGFMDKVGELQQKLQKQVDKPSEIVTSLQGNKDSGITQGAVTAAAESHGSSSERDQKVSDQEPRPVLEKSAQGHSSDSSKTDTNLKESGGSAERPAGQTEVGGEKRYAKIQYRDDDVLSEPLLAAKVAVEPWVAAFPEDDASLAKRKYVFCISHSLQFKELHNKSRHKKLKMQLQRGQKQWRRELALKKKLMLKFLTGDERKRAEEALKPDNGSNNNKDAQAAKYRAELTSLTERSAMLEKLLGFWRRRMATCDDELVEASGNFRKQVRSVLEGVQRLALLLGAGARPRRRAIALSAAANQGGGTRRTSGIFLSAVSSIASMRRNSSAGSLGSRRKSSLLTAISHFGNFERSTSKESEVKVVSDETQALEFVATLLSSLSGSRSSMDPRLRSNEAVLSDSLLNEHSGEELFRGLLKKTLALPQAQRRVAFQRLIELEQARLLFVVRHALMHQFKHAMAAGQRVIACLESSPADLLRQLEHGGPLFPTLSSSEQGDASVQITAERNSVQRQAAKLVSKFLAVDQEAKTGVEGAGSKASTSARRISAGSATGLGFEDSIAGKSLAQVVQETEKQDDIQHERQNQQDSTELTGTEKIKSAMRLALTANKTKLKKVQRGKSALSLVSDARFIKCLAKFESLMAKSGRKDNYDGQWQGHIGHDDRPTLSSLDTMPERSFSAPGLLSASKFRKQLPGAALGRTRWLRRATKAPTYNADFVAEWEAIRAAVRQSRDDRIASQHRRVAEMHAEFDSTQEDGLVRTDSATILRQISKNNEGFEDEGAAEVKDQVRRKVNEFVKIAAKGKLWRSKRHQDGEGAGPSSVGTTREYNAAIHAVKRKIGFWRQKTQLEPAIGRGRWLLDSELFDVPVEPTTSLEGNSGTEEVLHENNKDEKPEKKQEHNADDVVCDQALGIGLTVMPPWKRKEYASDAAWSSLEDFGPTAFMCWLQPILMEARLTMAPTSETCRPNWLRWSPMTHSNHGIDIGRYSSNAPKVLKGQLKDDSKGSRKKRTLFQKLKASPSPESDSEQQDQHSAVQTQSKQPPVKPSKQPPVKPDIAQCDEVEDQAVMARHQGIFLCHEHRSLVIEVEDQLRQGLRGHGRLLENTLRLPLVVIVQTALAQDQGFVEVLSRLSRDEFVAAMASILNDLEEAYTGDGVTALDYEESGHTMFMSSGADVESGHQKKDEAASELFDMPHAKRSQAGRETRKNSRKRSKRDPLVNEKQKHRHHHHDETIKKHDRHHRHHQPPARHRMIGELKLGRTALVSASVSSKPMSAGEIAGLKPRGLDLESSRPARSRYLCGALENSAGTAEEQKQWRKTTQTKPLYSDVSDGNRLQATPELAVVGVPNLSNIKSQVCKANLVDYSPCKPSVVAVSSERVLTERALSSAVDLTDKPTAKEEDAESAFRQHFEQWQEWRCQKSVRSPLLHQRTDDKNASPQVPAISRQLVLDDSVGSLPAREVDHIPLWKSEDISGDIDSGQAFRNSAVEKRACNANNISQQKYSKNMATTGAFSFPPVTKPQISRSLIVSADQKLRAVDLTAAHDAQTNHPVHEQVHDRQAVTDGSLNNYLTDFRDFDLELLLSDFSRPGTSAGSRPSTRSSRPGTRDGGASCGSKAKPLSDLPSTPPESMPCWPHLGWSSKIAENSDSKDRAATSSTTLPSLRGLEHVERSLPGTADTHVGSCLSSTGESWRRALSSRAESPRWLHTDALGSSPNRPLQRSRHGHGRAQTARGPAGKQDMTLGIMPPRSADGLLSKDV